MEATMRELNQQTARVIGAVERGETVTVTKDGRHVATILPPSLAAPVYPFRTDPMGEELDDMPVIPGGGGRILADLDQHMEGFGR
ncbi:type II toxin-antitoxin system Phd/YefM family antitoxin [Kitasatospora sp. NPDC059811]|uniref:type II toxin-antitoxin system Phd/YefM family antitoxin n=1 Tax=Streptomycetaceae TaxID=2062 RepID=UPI0007AEEECA|nr:type II toxin-antitoxin system prevent-host-death family antitoxin [Streptomyces sp. MJM8645]